MRTPPEGIAIGDRLSQEEIEDVFDTGFGYRISGINPRRDSQDRRYVLVFANEDGPYDDSVTHGQFQYIGEGLKGDQSETSPGNSVLIDAIASNIPIHFFYQQSETEGWEYHGLVDVLDYNYREQGGREVIVFQMKHRDQSADVSWLEAVRQELDRYRETHNEHVVNLDELYEFSEDRLAARFPNNDHVRAKLRQQLQRLREEGEIEFLDDQGTYRITQGDDIQQAKTELEQVLESDPELTEDTEKFTESRRRARDLAFVELVRDAYNQTCAFCGSSRETPAGDPEVEAAHIYPKRKDGADDVRNGLALCKLHHWAFDTGWLAVTDEYELLVKDAPDRDGYYEFKQLEGESIRLPEEDQAKPHPVFLEAHRDLNGF